MDDSVKLGYQLARVGLSLKMTYVSGWLAFIIPAIPCR